MKKLVIMLLLLGAGFVAWDRATPNKPEWFMRLVAGIGLFDTAVYLDLDRDTDFTEESLKARLDHLYLSCDPQVTKLGDRVCWTHISEFNGIPARMIAFFFKKGRYNYLRVSFDREHHPRVKSLLDQGYTYLGTSTGSRKIAGQDLGMWESRGGILSTLVAAPINSDETLLTWLRQ